MSGLSCAGSKANKRRHGNKKLKNYSEYSLSQNDDDEEMESSEGKKIQIIMGQDKVIAQSEEKLLAPLIKKLPNPKSNSSKTLPRVQNTLIPKA